MFHIPGPGYMPSAVRMEPGLIRKCKPDGAPEVLPHEILVTGMRQPEKFLRGFFLQKIRQGRLDIRLGFHPEFPDLAVFIQCQIPLMQLRTVGNDFPAGTAGGPAAFVV